jgi:hypothetical protein
VAQFVLVHQMDERRPNEYVATPIILNFDLVRQIRPPWKPGEPGRYGYVELTLIGADQYHISLRESFEELRDKLKSNHILIE